MIQSIERGITVLEILEKEKLVSVVDIARKLEINKSSAHRLLATLESKHIVEKDKVTKKYKLGLGLLKFANRVLGDMEITQIAKPYLEELVVVTQESSHLCVLSKNKAVFVDQKKSSEIISISASIGDEEPVYCSAVGKNLIAFLPKDELEKVLDTIEFKAFTPRTITSKQALLTHLEKIREQGYAIDDEEIYSGVRCVAAPIRNHEGKVVAAIGISGPASRIQLEKIDKYASSVKEVAMKVSRKLGFTEKKL